MPKGQRSPNESNTQYGLKMTESPLCLRLASYLEDSLVDGPGLRFTVFAQGCPHRCPGCHNPETQLPIGGVNMAVSELYARYEAAKMHRGVTLSGGEPFIQAAPLAAFAALVHQGGGDVITYTGFVYEKLLQMAEKDPGIAALLRETDLLIDGPFILAQKSLSLPFRGSRNQRLIPLSEAGRDLLSEIPV